MKRDIGIFVPARLNSHRLPKKQVLPIGDRCMFDICCQKLDYIKREYDINTYVLVYDKELIEIAQKYPNVNIKLRDIGTVEAEGSLKYIYKDILNVKEKYLMFLNPCLIFLKTDTIVAKIDEFLASGKEYGTSVKEFKNWVWDKHFIAQNYIDYKRLTTKEIDPWYQCAHCFHIFNREMFINDGYMLKDDLVLLHIPHEETIDIDTKEEYEYAKWKWENSEICI